MKKARSRTMCMMYYCWRENERKKKDVYLLVHAESISSLNGHTRNQPHWGSEQPGEEGRRWVERVFTTKEFVLLEFSNT